MTSGRWGKVRLSAVLRISPDFNALAVYVFLCTHADLHGRAWPETETIAASLGVSTRTVQRGLRTLRDHVEIETHPQGGIRIIPDAERAHMRKLRDEGREQ